jgi:Tol biopolymer transport system component
MVGISIVLAASVLGSGGEVSRQTFAPTPGEVYYSSNRDATNFELYRVPISGGASTRLTTTTQNETLPALSPDGNRIAFLRNGVVTVLRFDLSGSSVYPNITNVSGLGWTTDSRFVVFATNGGTNLARGIYGLSLTTGQIRLICVPPTVYTLGKFATHRSNNVFAVEVRRGSGPWQIGLNWAINNRFQIVTDGQDPSWSRDGSRIVFANTRIYSIYWRGTDLRELYWRSGTTMRYPKYTDLDRKLVFAAVSDSGTSPYNIYVVNSDRTNLMRLTNVLPTGDKLAHQPTIN